MSQGPKKIKAMSKYRLKKLIEKLDDIRGRNTELVSIYVPAGYDMAKISEFVASESAEAENIKSKHTRKNVQAALDKIGRRLKEVTETPENGVVFFAGNVSDTEGRPDIQIWEIIPPEPVESRHYRCDKEFVLQPLKDMIVDDRVYGLIVTDKSEAAIGYLQGSSIKTAYTMSSNVPGKTRAGGQCLDPDSMVQMSDGRLKKIDNINVGEEVKSADFDSMSLKDSQVTDKWNEEKEVYRIETKFPRRTITASGDHEVFTSKLQKKAVENLEEGEKLIFPEKINSNSKNRLLNVEEYYNSFRISDQGRQKIKQLRKEKNLSRKVLSQEISVSQTAISKIELGERDVKNKLLRKLCEGLNIEFTEFINSYCRGKNYKLPKTLDRELAEILGYFAGDGSFDPERLNFHESDQDVAEYYRQKLESKFGCNTRIKFRDDKNYYLLRAFGKPVVEFIRNEFPEIKKSHNTHIPEKILEAEDKILFGFIQGFYDAEGHCSKSRSKIGISSNNKILMQQLQSGLLRAGITASLTEYDNSKNPYTDKVRYTINISDTSSIHKFGAKIGFCSHRKSEELDKVCQIEKSKNNNRQIIESEEEVRCLIERDGLKMEDFKSANTFLQGKRDISKEAFEKNFLEKSEGKIKEELENIHNSELLPTKIASIEKKEKQKVVDISVSSGNFLANGLVVHNSAQRFARIRESMLDTFLKEIADKSKTAFLEKARDDDLLGIIVGGPGFTKDKLIDDGYLHTELEEKVIATESLNYSGEDAMKDLVQKAEDAIQDSAAVAEKRLVQEFFTNLKEENGKSEYGLEQVMKALKMGAVETVLISEDYEMFRADYKCPNGHEKQVFEEEAHISDSIECSECNEDMDLEEMSDIVDVISDKAEEMSSDVEFISSSHEEGERLNNFGGIAAILRYRIR